MALMLRDMGVHLTHPDWTFDIFGTDLNTERLDAARRGGARRGPSATWTGVTAVATSSRRRSVPPEGRVRRSVRFREGNLASDRVGRPPDRDDIILCKNVAIYFRPEVTRRLVEAAAYDALNDGGYLLLGHSESLWQMESGFTLVEHDGVFCYRKPPVAPGDAVAPPRSRRPISQEHRRQLRGVSRPGTER